MNKSIITKMVENCEAENMSVQFLQCGSSINNPFARDIDIMVYTCNNLYNYFTRFQEQFKNEHIIKKNYIKIWNMYSLKIKVNKDIISFHIVSFEDLRDYMSRVDEPEIYIDISYYSFSWK